MTGTSNRQLIANRYALGELLGQGGVGMVYHGTDTQTDQPVAIKLLKPEMVATHPQVVQRFAREAEALRALDHPNIVKVLATAFEQDKHYLVMEFVSGGSLRDVLGREGQLTVARTLEIALDLADALTRAHRVGIIHRDIKPANVLLAQDGTPRLTDFGLARASASPRLTQTGMPLGTCHYLSPESCRGEEVDSRADIWAFGVLLFEMLVGHCPFEADDPLALALAITTQPIPDLAALRPEAPSALTNLVRRMLEKDRELRIPSVRLAGAELEAIMRGVDTPVSATRASHTAGPELRLPGVPIHNLPVETTRFVGRKTEMAELAVLFADPQVRLVTILGPGGIGKTRLALEAAKARLPDFKGGVFFVPLAPLSSTENIVTTVAETVGFQFYEGSEPRQQLLDFLRQKQMLLVMDNYEHLLEPATLQASHVEEGMAGGADLIAAILGTAPDLKLLVTSREALNLQQEWLYPIHGLPVPSNDDVNDSEGFGAVQLFVERASHVRPGSSLTDEWKDVIHICRLVEGMPLALELAASWTRTLSCAAIAAEIQGNLDFLATRMRDVPERHRSMRAALDYSWQHLNQQQRTILKRLSVFRGGFQRAAAEQVTATNLTTLTALVDKSLLRWDPDGRFQVHELIRQYAEERLTASPAEAERIRDVHCAYFMERLHQRQADMDGGRQREVTLEFAADIDNVRQAWRRAVDKAYVDAIHKAASTLEFFHDIQGNYVESAEVFETAVKRLEGLEQNPHTAAALASVLASRGWRAIRLGQLDKATAVFERSQAIYDDLSAPPPPSFATDPLVGLGVLANIHGNYATAAQLGERARQRQVARNDMHNLQLALYVLANAAFAQGEYETARDYARQAIALTERTGNRWFTAYVLSDLGNVARALGAYDEARGHYQKSYAIKQEFEDPEGMAAALNHLAKIAWLQEDWVKAKHLYQQSLSIYREINDRGGLATSLNGLGDSALASRDLYVARQYYQQALETTSDMQFAPLTLTVLTGVGSLLLQVGQTERGVELLGFVVHHPASDQETRDQARRRLEDARVSWPSQAAAATTQDGQTSDLELLAAAVLDELAGIELMPAAAPSPADSPVPPPDQPLIDPLTPRELEVLQLLADGLSNQEIADRLIIAVGTVKSYTGHIYSKLDVRNRIQAVTRARELQLL